MMNWARFLTAAILSTGLTSACALQEHTGLWTGFAVVGPARFGPDIKYYYDAQLQLIDDPYKFDEVYASAGLGKESGDWLFFVINSFSVAKSLSGDMHYEDKFYEEANWRKVLPSNTTLIVRSRLEERVRFSESGVNLRWRERLMLRVPIVKWPNNSLVIYDEVFLNINRPDWVTDKFYEQNRFFIGIGKVVSNKLTVDFGYLNKLNFSNPTLMTNILLISFNITGKSHYIKE